MTQHPYDQLSKQLLEELLAPFGRIQRSLEIPGEAKWVDLWFEPDVNSAQLQTDDLFSCITRRPCLLEPYRNPPSQDEVRSCLLKLHWVQEDLRRKSEKLSLTEDKRPELWIIATSISKPLLRDFGAVGQENGTKGIYFAPPGFCVIFVSINELPRTRETLFLRLLGRGNTQSEAVSDVLDLSPDDSQRLQMLRILGNWKIAIESNQIEVEGQEIIMAFSQAFLEWEKATEEKGIQKGLERGLEQGLEQGLKHERSLILRLLTQKIGEVPSEMKSQMQTLSRPQIEALGDALLEFQQVEDLRQWLSEN